MRKGLSGPENGSECDRQTWSSDNKKRRLEGRGSVSYEADSGVDAVVLADMPPVAVGTVAAGVLVVVVAPRGAAVTPSCFGVGLGWVAIWAGAPDSGFACMLCTVEPSAKVASAVKSERNAQELREGTK